MRLPLHWRLIGFLACFLLIFFFIQGYMTYSLKKSFLISSLLGFLILLVLAYILSRFVTQPVSDLIDILRRLTGTQSEKKGQVYSKNEFSYLARATRERDVELRNKIEEITTEKDYLKTVLKGMAEGVLVVDQRGHIIMINDALRKLFSFSTEVVDKTPLELIRNAELETAIQEAIGDGKNSSFELTLSPSRKIESTTSGKIFEVNVVGILPSLEGLHKTEKGMRGAIAVFHDITRLKELEKIRQDFVANVSHELRTPLTTIKGYAETLLDGALQEDVAPQFVQVIKRHTDRLTKIVEDLLVLSKIESREFQMKLEAISIRDLIDDAIDFVNESAKKKKISVSRNDIPSSLALEADRNYLEQVLINLLDNAIKYTPEGGKVTISATEKGLREIQFSIEDNGIGIPEEDIPRIFERFYRVDKGRSQELGGTGLGLSIVKHMVHAHGGTVWVESQLEKGSNFYFTLPKR